MSPAMLPEHIETRIVDGTRRHKRSWLVGGLGTVGLGLLFAPIVYFTATPPPGVSPLFAAIFTVGLFGVIGAGLTLFALGDPKKAGGLQLLRTRPAGTIAWLFVQYPGRRRSSGAYVTFGFTDGKMSSVCVAVDEAAPLYEALRAHAPNATCGFSEQLLQQFHSAPQSLIREPS